MTDSLSLGLYVSIWLLATLAVLISGWKEGRVGVGLVFAYLTSLSLIHWPGAAVYVLPWYWNHDPRIVASGFQQSTYGVIAFGVAVAVLAPFLMRVLHFPPPVSSKRVPERRLSYMYVGIGLASYFVLLPLASAIPTATALASAGWQLLVVGLGLSCWKAWRERRSRRFVVWLIAALCLPFFTIITQGFLGYGTVAFLAVFSFISTFYRPRWKLVILGLALTYFGFSFYVSYMRDRNEIRQVVWGGQSLDRRVEQVYSTLSSIEWFNPYDTAHLRRIDDRLNQNYLVGAAIQHLQSGAQKFAAGETLVQAMIALIPRAIWPKKPVVAGSMDLATTYTGIPFAHGTSVGIGQVLEFYINFGTLGIVVGFLVLGVIISVIDTAAHERLINGDWQGFVLWYLPGIAFLQAGGSLVEVTSSAGAAVVTALLVNRFVLRHLSGRRVGRYPQGVHPAARIASRDRPSASPPKGKHA